MPASLTSMMKSKKLVIDRSMSLNLSCSLKRISIWWISDANASTINTVRDAVIKSGRTTIRQRLHKHSLSQGLSPEVQAKEVSWGRTLTERSFYPSRIQWRGPGQLSLISRKIFRCSPEI